jgi:hypothetical protein
VSADERLQKASEKEAWIEYLHETKTANELRYVEVESWAWARLQARLGKLKPKRKVAA